MLMTLLNAARAAFRCRVALVLENAALRRQLAAYVVLVDESGGAVESVTPRAC